MLKRYFAGQIHEIKNDPVLRIYGLFIALAHVLTFYYWHLSKLAILHMAENNGPVC